MPWRIITDPDPLGRPSAWRTYRACLESIEDETHLLICQDDAVCMPGFKQGVEAAVAAEPDRAISFFHVRWPKNVEREIVVADRNEQPFWTVPRGRWIPTVCLVWPAAMVRDLLDWSSTSVPPDFRGDDSVLGRYSNYRKTTALVTTRSLVEHPDDVPSLVSSRPKAWRHAVNLAGHADEWIAYLPPLVRDSLPSAP